VEAACLDLQDRFGADVNLALYCLWIGRVLDEAAMDAALETAAPGQARARILRERRRALPREADGGPRARAKRAELDAERAEQEALEALARPASANPQAAAANLRLYAARLGIDEPAFLAAAGPLLAALE
jgi:uncharacterized protein (TIGR02444 family)